MTRIGFQRFVYFLSFLVCASPFGFSQTRGWFATETTSYARDKNMEKAILEVINRMRSHPAAFYTQVIEPYVRQKPTAIHFTHSYVHSLRKEMLALSALPPLVENDTLQQTALELARDIVEHQGGRLSHNTSQGLDFAQRFQQAGIGCGAENLYTGTHRTAEDVVADWLIDQGVPSLGHRKNLLHPSYTRAGLVVLTNPKGQIWVVLDLGCDP